MKLVDGNDPILRTACDKFDLANPPFDPIEFSREIVKFMYDNNAVGLSANQIGVPYRIFAMRGAPENFVCFNPRVVMPGTDIVSLEETSLTFPGLIVKVKRPQHVRVRFNTPNGDIKTETFTGMTARIFQHQLDFLDGIIYYNKANRYHREKALEKWRNK